MFSTWASYGRPLSRMQSFLVPAVMSCWGITVMAGREGGREGISGPPDPPPPPARPDFAPPPDSVDLLRT